MTQVLSPRAGARAAKRLVRRHGGVVMGSISSTTSRSVVLTFDDGPDPDQTPRVLEALSGHGATATFFVLMTRVDRHPDLLRAIVEAGHEVALHGQDHRSLPGFGHREGLRRTASARSDLERACGVAVRWFRPPYGEQTPSSWLATRRAGLVPVLWSGTTWDWKDVSDEERRSVSLRAGREGAIVLAHDGIAGPDDGAAPSAHALADRAGHVEWLLAQYAERGLEVRSLGNALLTGVPVRSLELTGLRGRGHGDGDAVPN